MSVSNSVGSFDLDLINLRKPLKFNDGTIQSTAYTGSIGVPDLDHVLTSGNDANNNDIVNVDTIEFNYANIGNPYTFDDWVTLSNSEFQWNYTNASGGRQVIFHSAPLDASLVGVGKFRKGLLQQSANNELCSAVTTEKVFTTSNILSLTWGFIPLGSGQLSGGPYTDVGNVSYGFGTTSENASPHVFTPIDHDGIYWRAVSASASVPNWELVENNVVKHTLSGTNLTGLLAGKWCRAIIVFPTPTTYYGVFTNLTDNVSQTTATFNITAPTTDDAFNYLFVACGNPVVGLKRFAFDYLQLQSRCPPIDKTNSAVTSR